MNNEEKKVYICYKVAKENIAHNIGMSSYLYPNFYGNVKTGEVGEPFLISKSHMQELHGNVKDMVYMPFREASSACLNFCLKTNDFDKVAIKNELEIMKENKMGYYNV